MTIQGNLVESIVSRSPLKPPMPLVAPPPPDHCHINAASTPYDPVLQRRT